MNKEQNQLECPKCGEPINVSSAFSKQVEDRLRKEFEALQKSHEKEFEQSILKRAKKESDSEIRLLKDELEAQSVQVRDLSRTKAENVRLKREKDELREQIELEKEIEFSEHLKSEKGRIRTQLEGEYTFKVRELEKQLEDQKALAEEMKRKVEQGSIQLQGEVQELELEKLLRETFIHDQITEVKKGQRGADTLHVVRNVHGAECGKIYYESKRTKTFDRNWIKKLREDNHSIKADVLVLVTEAMPDGIEGYEFVDGVWVCSFWHVRSLSMVLRHGVLDVHFRFQVHQGKETKAEMLYNFLTGPEFKNQFEAILDGFKSIQDGYSKEKLQMFKIWKEREKQLDRILMNAAEFYGSVKGIAGSSMPDVRMLEATEMKDQLLLTAE
jgi:hypothetical protein